jgi:hypothetical protein
MKELVFTYSHVIRRVVVDDGDKADAAYAAIKTALEEHREYGNDKKRTVEVDYGIGVETILIGAIASISISGLEIQEETVIKRALWEKQLEAKVASRISGVQS